MTKRRIRMASCFALALAAALAASALPAAAATRLSGGFGVESSSAPAAASAKHRAAKEIVQFGRDVVVRAGESAEGVVVIGGSGEVLGTVEDDLVVIGGSARVEGEVEGDVVAVGGSVRLGPSAQVGGDAVALGGALEEEPGSRVDGDRHSFTVPLPRLGWLQDWAVSGLFMARPLPHRSAWAWGLALAMLLVYMLAAAAFPRAVSLCAQTIEARPATSLAVGLLGLGMAGPAAVLLAVSVLGLAALPLALCAGAAGMILGKAGLYRTVGSRLGVRDAGGSGMARGAGGEGGGPAAVALGGAAFTLVHAVPIAGLVAWGSAAALGLGAALLAAMDQFRGETGGIPAAAPAGEAGPAPAAAAPALLPPPEGRPKPAGAAVLARAGFWPRLGATAVDAVLFLVAAGLLPLVTAGLGGWAAYQIGMWTWKGTTIGGIVFGLRGERLDGRPMDLGVAVVRHLASYLSAAAGFIGFLWAAWDPDRQAWHDKIAGTVVVVAPRSEPLI